MKGKTNLLFVINSPDVLDDHVALEEAPARMVCVSSLLLLQWNSNKKMFFFSCYKSFKFITVLPQK